MRREVRLHGGQQPRDVLAHHLEVGIAFARLLVHVDRAADLDLHAVALQRGLADPGDQLHALVGVVARHGVAAAAQILLDQRDKW